MITSKSNSKSDLSLVELVNAQIGLRIFICITLLFLSLTIITMYDISNQTRDVEISIEQDCQELSSFIVSQFLIDNVQSVAVKLNRMNKKIK